MPPRTPSKTRSATLPRVSVIINNYNYAAFLPEAVASALDQTYENCEVIVVDDGSSDRSREVLKGFESRARIVLKDNGGQTSALNLGFQLSTGDLIAFLDSDDALRPEAMQTVVATWRDSNVKVQFPLQIRDPAGQSTGLLMPRARLSEGNLLKQSLTLGRYITSPTSGNVYSRAFLQEIFPIPEDIWPHGDAYMNTCAPFYGTVGVIGRPLGFYRVHGPSMSAVVSGDVIDMTQMQKLMDDALRERALLEQLAQSHGLQLSKKAVFSHWMHLKLRVAYYRLADSSRSKRFLDSAREMLVSLATAPDLTLFRKLQNMAWTVGVVLLPHKQARKCISYAFDFAPRSLLGRMLRSM
jgi:glycosyltransferase involved in cell wall biosynthesis